MGKKGPLIQWQSGRFTVTPLPLRRPIHRPQRSAAVAGFAVAAEMVESERAEQVARQSALRDSLETTILARVPQARVAGRATPRLPNLSGLLIDGTAAESLVAALDVAGLEVSAGSACSSGAAQPSHVMTAIGEDPQATALLRISLGRGSTSADVAEAVDRIVAAIGVALAFPTPSAARAVTHS